jgi:hypothetical protein
VWGALFRTMRNLWGDRMEEVGIATMNRPEANGRRNASYRKLK